MSRKVLLSVLCTIAVIIAIISAVNINPEKSSPQTTQSPGSASAEPVLPSPSSYEIKLTGENVCLYTLDESGSELERKTLEYIDIYSLRSAQLDALRTGAKFKSREAAAEFIQDLDS